MLDTANRKTVELPRGETVQAITAVDEECLSHGFTGHCLPELLAPYAKQPRLFMDQAKLEELKTSVKHQGVRETIIVTPSIYAPWAVFHEGDEDLPFLIVSGHRRRLSALAGEVAAVPIEVRIYANESAFDDDAELLNDNRADLSDLEEGFRYRRRLEGGEKITHIVSATGHPYQMIRGRVNLTFLCPKIQKLIGPDLKPRDRLATGFAGALGGVDALPDEELIAKLEELGKEAPDVASLNDEERRFLLQHAYLNYCKKQGWKGVVSETFIKTGRRPQKPMNNSGRHSGYGAAEGTKKPKLLREAMLEWFVMLNRIGFLDKSPGELQKAFSLAVRVDLEALADRLQMVVDALREVAAKKPTLSAEALGPDRRKEQDVLED